MTQATHPTQPFPRLIALIWLLALAWWAGRWFWVWWPAPADVVLPSRAAIIPDSSALASAHLFGAGSVSQAAASDVRIVGLNTDAQQGFALIEVGGKLMTLVRGERLPDGRVLQDIHAEGVLLARDGRREFQTFSRTPR